MVQFINNKRELLKEKCLAYLGGKKCGSCGIEHLPICCYDFHHKKGDKTDTVGRMIRKKEDWRVIQKELDKCVVLCANCHRTKHWEIRR